MSAVIFANPYIVQPPLPISNGVQPNQDAVAAVPPASSGLGGRGTDTSESHRRRQGNGGHSAAVPAKFRGPSDATSKSVIEALSRNEAQSARKVADEPSGEQAVDHYIAPPIQVGFRKLNLPDPIPIADVLLLQG